MKRNNPNQLNMTGVRVYGGVAVFGGVSISAGILAGNLELGRIVSI